MRDFEHAYHVLLRVIKDNQPFNLAVTSQLKTEKKRIDNYFKASVSSVAGCTLRHYYVFQEICLRKYPEISEENNLLVSLGLANHIFAHRFSEKDFVDYIQEKTGYDDINEFFLTFDGEDTKLIPSDVEPGSKKFICLRYNLPLWIVNMWQKNCGPFLAKKLFRSLSFKDLYSVVRIDHNNIDDNEFIQKYEEFELFENPGVARHKKGNAKKHPCLESDALLYPLGYKYMCEDLDLDPLRGIAVYSGCQNPILKELYVRLGRRLKMEYLVSHQKDFFEAQKFAKKTGMTDVAFYETKHDAFSSCISKPVHTLFVCPENTNFNNLIEKPDYFLKIQQDQLDGFIQKQRETLNAAAKHVEDGGYLIYFLPTVCKNETRGNVRAFLNEHPEFKLENEKQLFPFDPYKSMLYFAVLRKEESHD